MENNNTGVPTDAAKLRRRAEARLEEAGRRVISDTDYARELHELQVHQIELEMQNEELRRAQTETEVARENFADFYELSPVGYLTLKPDGAIREANLTAARLLGLMRSKLLGRRLGSFVSAKYQPAFDALLAKVFASHTRQTSEVMLTTADNHPLYAHLEVIAAASGQTCLMVMVDTTERHEREEALRLAAIVFDSVDNAILVSDRQNKIVSVNPAFTDITGYTPEEVIGKDPNILSSGRHPPGFYRKMWATLNATGSWQGEIMERRKNGEIFVKWLAIKQVRDEYDQLTHYVATFSRLTERNASEERLYHMAYHDPLTDLPNRMLLADRLRQALASARRDQSHLAVMYFDLDKFKPVNDNFGHNVGDLLLQEVATRIQDCLRESDTAARMGGDEFVVLLPNIENEQSALLVAEKIRSALALPYELAGHTVNIATSIGIAVYPLHGSTEHELLKSADAAMYRAKQDGGNRINVHRKKNT